MTIIRNRIRKGIGVALTAAYTQNNAVTNLFGYSGNLFRLSLASSPTTQQDFAVGYTTADILAFCSSNESNLKLVTRYDITGNGNHVTQSTDALRPAFRRSPDNSEWVVLYGLTRYKQSDVNFYNVWLGNNLSIANTNQLFVMDIGINIHENATANDINAIPVSHQFGAAASDFSWFTTLTSITATPPSPNTVPVLYGYFNGGLPTYSPAKNLLLEDTFPTWQYFRNTPLQFQLNNRGLISTTSIVNRATTGYQQGLAFSGSRNICYTNLIGEGVSDADIEVLKSAILPLHNIPTTNPTRQIIIAGDSISSGYNYLLLDESYLYSYIYLALKDNFALRSNCLIRNRAVYSGHLNSSGSGGFQFREMLPVVGDRFNIYYDATQFPNGQLVIVWIGTNDLFYGRTGTQVHTDLNSFCTALQTAGFTVLVLDCIPRQDLSAGQQTERTTFNTLVAANWATYADDFLQISALDWTPSGSYATYYVDGVHPNPLAQDTLVVPSILPKIISLLGL